MQHIPIGSQEAFWINEYDLQLIGGQIASTFNISVSDIPSMDYRVYTKYGDNFRKEIVPEWNETSKECLGGTGLDGFRLRVDNVAMSLTNA